MFVERSNQNQYLLFTYAYAPKHRFALTNQPTKNHHSYTPTDLDLKLKTKKNHTTPTTIHWYFPSMGVENTYRPCHMEHRKSLDNVIHHNTSRLARFAPMAPKHPTIEYFTFESDRPPYDIHFVFILLV